jgi:ferredoxin, 2Fe-2S
MVKITIENLGQKEVIGSDTRTSALKLLLENGVDWMHACGGKGRCTTCKMIVMHGMENLSQITPAELKYREMKQLATNERLACQTRPLGEVAIRVAHEYKLPHIDYSD